MTQPSPTLGGHTANGVCPIVTTHWEWLRLGHETIVSKALTLTHIDHKVKPYSKPMAIIPHVPVCHVLRCN
jgi:hypothetical protein